tara:strand:- start:306 stop:3524 length:3219 start_codon:yes stop_codon:yes gene_type:complete
MKINYNNKNITINFNLLKVEKDDFSLYNILNELIINGILYPEKNYHIVDFEYFNSYNSIDEFSFRKLGFPDYYKFDIYLSHKGSGLADKHLKLNYSFQNFSHGDGSGKIIYQKDDRVGLKLENKIGLCNLLNYSQFNLINMVDKFNKTKFLNIKQRYKAVAEIQELAIKASSSMSKTLKETVFHTLNEIDVRIKKIDEDVFKIDPISNKINSEVFNDILINKEVREIVKYTNGNIQSKVILSDGDDRKIIESLNKIKESPTISSKELIDINENLQKFYDIDIVNLNGFSDRVIELGIYKPKFYPFIQPYKNIWIPGIVIDDKKHGKIRVTINNFDELSEVKAKYKSAIANNNKNIDFKDETINIDSLDSIIDIAEKQLNSPISPVTNKEDETKKPLDKRVLIISENTDVLDYVNKFQNPEDVDYKFSPIYNLKKTVFLKEHQKIGISWLQSMSEFDNNDGVLLADDMGLGKTLQVLYFIEWYTKNRSVKPILIVAPVSLLENWENEYIKFFDKHECSIYSLRGNSVYNYINVTDALQTKLNFKNSSIYLTTYETLRRHQISLGVVDWGLLILDEAQKIKTPSTLITNAAKAMKSDFKIAMTGTPVENSLMDLWCIIDFCRPGLLFSAKDYSNQYIKPQNNKDTDLDELSNSLRQSIGHTLMRRLKEDVAKDLPKKIIKKYYVNMNDIQFKIYSNETKRLQENPSAMLSGLLKLKSISNHPFLKTHQLENIPTNELIDNSVKLDKTIKIIESVKEKNEKCIVFTEDKSMQRLIRRVINDNFNINPSIINGDTPSSKSINNRMKLSRQQEVDKFQNKNGFNIIIMSPLSAGVGLNVTGANHVIHYSRHWNPAKEQQATDRVYRIGQTKEVFIHYPIAVSPDKSITFDKSLDKLLEYKENQSRRTLFPSVDISPSELNEELTPFNDIDFNVTYLSSVDDLDKLKPLLFEAAIALLIEKKFDGSAYLTPKSNDKGADVLFFGNQDLLIQVKQSKTHLGISSGQEVSYALNEYNKKYSKTFIPYIITNSFLNKAAIESAKENDITYIDRVSLSAIISQYPITICNVQEKYEDERKGL